MNIDFNKISLCEGSSVVEKFENGNYQVTTILYIMYEDDYYGGLRIGEVRIITSSLNMKYIEHIEINKDCRNSGIATHILTKYFKGYFISAGNLRVTSLYNRIGRGQTHFTDEECRTLAYNTGMYGTFIIE